MKTLKTFLETRIAELNEADAGFCKDRWDMSKPANERDLYRGLSNEMTFARKELQEILKKVNALLPVEPAENFVPHVGGFQIIIAENAMLQDGKGYLHLSKNDYKRYSEKSKNKL